MSCEQKAKVIPKFQNCSVSQRIPFNPTAVEISSEELFRLCQNLLLDCSAKCVARPSSKHKGRSRDNIALTSAACFGGIHILKWSKGVLLRVLLAKTVGKSLTATASGYANIVPSTAIGNQRRWGYEQRRNINLLYFINFVVSELA